MVDSEVLPPINPATLQSSFVKEKGQRSLKVTCYGSSSAKTPEAYLDEARSLGYILAKRGHVCVNGAGSFGCMAAMNEGAMVGDGHLVGVIHEMFLVDDGYGGKTISRDGGSHFAFQAAFEEAQKKTKTPSKKTNGNNSNGPLRKILIAGGKDLQERKRMLVEQAEGLVVLPGGPGTWDELWEMACSRHLGLTRDLPIVCVNVNDYYAPFQQMLERAYEDKLIRLPPEQIVHFCSSAEEAVKWLEEAKAGAAGPGSATAKKPMPKLLRRSSALKRSSFFSAIPGDAGDGDSASSTGLHPQTLGLGFMAGLGCGMLLMIVATRR